MTTAERIASWIYRDLSLRGGFREVTDQVGPSGGNMIVDFWAKRIEEEIGDARFITALEKIANLGNDSPEASTIAKRALLPIRHAGAAAAGVTTFAADSQAVQLDMKYMEDRLRGALDQGAWENHPEIRGEIARAVGHSSAPTPNAESVTPPPAIDLDDFS